MFKVQSPLQVSICAVSASPQISSSYSSLTRVSFFTIVTFSFSLTFSPLLQACQVPPLSICRPFPSSSFHLYSVFYLDEFRSSQQEAPYFSILSQFLGFCAIV